MRRRLRLGPISCLAVVLLAACDSGWVQPLGGPDHASYNPGENVLTLANVATLQQAFNTGSGAAGTPVVKDGVLVVAPAGGNTVTAFNGNSGAQLWQRTLPDQINGGPFIDGTTVRVSYGPPAPLYGPSVEQRLDLLSGAEDVPLGTNGAMVARRGDNSVRLHEIAANGVNERAFAQISGKPLDGELPLTSARSATLGANYLYVTGTTPSGSAGLWAFDPNQDCADRCTAAWSHIFGPDLTSVETPAIGPDGTLYVTGTGPPVGNDLNSSLTALDGNTGSVKWSVTSSPLPLGTPAVANGVVYLRRAILNSADITVAAVSAADGHTLWIGQNLIYANLTVAGGVVYGTFGDEVLAFDANGCGQAACPPIWFSSVGNQQPTGVAVSGGVLYVGTNNGVTAFKPTTS
jgi:outer membrane protein assembly factor BamB